MNLEHLKEVGHFGTSLAVRPYQDGKIIMSQHVELTADIDRDGHVGIALSRPYSKSL